MAKNSPLRVGVKTMVLAVALLGVIYLMAQLRSETQTLGELGEKNPFTLLFGEDAGRPLNWCPKDVQSLQVLGVPPETVTDQTQIQSYCQLLTESFDSTKLNKQSFKPVLKAFSTSGAEAVIESDSTGKV